MSQFRTILACICAAISLSAFTLSAGDDNNNNNGRDRGGDRGGGRGGFGRGGFTPPGGNNNDANGANGAAGGRAFGGGFGGGGFDIGALLGGGVRGMGGSGLVNMTARSLGVDIQDPKATPKVEDLPLGASKHQITNIPVGGVDNLANTGKGWKMESIFTLTPEGTKSVEALRDEYEFEQKKLQKEIAAQSQALAEKAIALRQQFEKRANDLLQGAEKEQKEKLDALTAEVRKKNADLLAETLPLYDINDNTQTMNMIRALSEKTNQNSKEGELKLIDLIPEKSKEKVQTLIKSQDEARDRLLRSLQTGGRRGGPGGGAPDAGGAGVRGGPRGDAVKPPTPPEATENKF